MACVAIWLTCGAAASQDVTGTWLAEGGNAQVRVAACGASRCGTIVWRKAERRDVHNPDPSRRSRNLVGVQIFGEARPTTGGWTGRLYSPLDGQTYAGTLRLTSPGELELSGCVLAGLICRSQTWTRVR